MPYAAITYRVKPGHEDEIAEIFANFRRVDSPVLRDEDGTEVGELLGTAVFIRDDLMVRVIHYQGDFAAIGRHMAKQQGVHSLESKLAPYLAEQRDTKTTEGFQTYFRNATMRCISQLSREEYVPPQPA
ncbi:SchA/CurD-like domain-containing protein [Micromonospora sp. WMMD558]|uniref:SchA/CurD-like domain-containing protein n=1 Tax=Micromonospora sp. WMMD558 TaxID=3403462 RepID=UPI003BF4DAD9